MVRITFWIIIEPLLHVLYVGLEISYSSKNRVLLKSWCSRFETFDVFEKLKNPKKIALSCMFSAIVLIQIGQFCCPFTKKIVGLLCGQFWATDLPHSSFEWLCPKDFRGTPDVDLVSIIWRPAPSKVMISKKLSKTLGHFEAVFLTEMIFLAKRSIFAYFIMHVCKAKIGIFRNT